MMNKRKYITTTLPYANSNPHIGHAFEFIIADALARHFKYRGDSVFFKGRIIVLFYFYTRVLNLL